MIKKIITAFLSAVMIISLSACSNNTNDDKNNTDNISNSNNKTNTTINTVTNTDMELAPYLIRAKDTDSNLYGYVDARSGKMVIKPQFTVADDYFGEDGWAYVKNQNDQSNIINTDGNTVFVYGEHETISANYYEGKYILVRDGIEVNLYEGANHIKKLELPQKDIKKVSFGVVSRNKSFVEPKKFFPIVVEYGSDERKTNWFDHTGKFICTTNQTGNLVSDSTGYYHFYDGIEQFDTNGKFIKNIDPNEDVLSITGNTMKTYGIYVSFDEDNWYAAVNEQFLLTNGLQKLNLNNGGAVSVKDGIIATRGHYYNTKGEIIYNFGYSSLMNTPWYAFSNGYALVAKGSFVGNTRDQFCGYIDTTGKEILYVGKGNVDNYSKALKDGYIVYCENGLYGIKNIDGRVICEPSYIELFYMEPKND